MIIYIFTFKGEKHIEIQKNILDIEKKFKVIVVNNIILIIIQTP